jgi:hypothetical protein
MESDPVLNRDRTVLDGDQTVENKEGKEDDRDDKATR